MPPTLVPAVIDQGRPAGGGNTYLGLHSMGLATPSIASLSGNVTYYAPLLVLDPIVIDQLSVEITTAGVAGALQRLGLYAADKHWQPTDLIIDAGTIPGDSTGKKDIVGLLLALARGRYLTASHVTGGSQQVRTLLGSTWAHPNLGATPFLVSLQAAGAVAALPNPGTAWSTGLASNGGFRHFVVPRISVP